MPLQTTFHHLMEEKGFDSQYNELDPNICRTQI